jgi:hypothetical protein
MLETAEFEERLPAPLSSGVDMIVWQPMVPNALTLGASLPQNIGVF